MIGIVAAFKDEIRGYLKRGKFRLDFKDDGFRFYRSELNPDVRVIDGGIGKLRAQQAADKLIQMFKPELVVTAGFAGALRREQHTGDLFICDQLFAVEGQASAWRPETAKQLSMVELSVISKSLRVRQGIGRTYSVCGLLSVPELVTGGSMKRKLGATFPAGLVDMESYWVGETAASHDIPFISIRTVFDTVEQTLPGFVGQAANGEVGKMWLRAAKYVAAHPIGTPSLMKLAAQSRSASSSLGRFLAALTSIER